MKKGFIGMIAVLAVAAIFTSCKKQQYICVCNVNYGGQTTPYKYDLGKVTDNRAHKDCDAQQQEITYHTRLGVASCKVELDDMQ